MAWWARWKFPSPKWTIPDVTAERSYVGAKKALASDAATDDCVEVPNVLVMFVLLSHSGVGGFVVDAEPAMLPSAYPACCGGTKRPADAAEVREERLSALRSHSFPVLPVAKGGGIPRFGPLPVYAQFSYGFVRGAAVRFRTPARLHTGRGSFWDALTTAWVYSVRRRASGRSFSKTGEWPVLFENGRVAGPFRTGKDVALSARRRRRKPSVRHVLIRAYRPEAPQTYCLFGAACLHVGALGGNHFRMEGPTFGVSSSGRVGRSLPAEGRSCFCGEQFFLFAEGSSCFSPKTRTALAFRPKRGRLLLFAQK